MAVPPAAATRAGKDARLIRDRPVIDRIVRVEVACCGGEERRRISDDCGRLAARRRPGARTGVRVSVLEGVNRDAIDGGGRSYRRTGPVLERGRGVQVIRVTIVALRREPDLADQRRGPVLLQLESLLGREQRLEVRLRLALLGARLELHEVRDCYRRKQP